MRIESLFFYGENYYCDEAFVVRTMLRMLLTPTNNNLLTNITSLRLYFKTIHRQWDHTCREQEHQASADKQIIVHDDEQDG
jgi:hypothetical protein